MTHILIADDHEIVRSGIKMILNSYSEKHSIAEANSCLEIMDQYKKSDIKFAILDMQFSDGNVLTMLQDILSINSGTSILIYSMNSEKIYAKRFLRLGAKGFVSKRSGLDELEKAIATLLRGDLYLSTELQKLLYLGSRSFEPENPIDSLSDRELEVIEFVAVGMGTKEIARKLNLDITTVSTYRRRAFEKFNVENMIELKDKFMLYKGMQ
jgi:two-component system invasion response regulator UvrY